MEASDSFAVFSFLLHTSGFSALGFSLLHTLACQIQLAGFGDLSPSIFSPSLKYTLWQLSPNVVN